jgi:alcohol dehydrogenase (NADP+)
MRLGGVTYGGYSNSVVVDERFVLRVPSSRVPEAGLFQLNL